MIRKLLTLEDFLEDILADPVPEPIQRRNEAPNPRNSDYDPSRYEMMKYLGTKRQSSTQIPEKPGINTHPKKKDIIPRPQIRYASDKKYIHQRTLQTEEDDKETNIPGIGLPTQQSRNDQKLEDSLMKSISAHHHVNMPYIPEINSLMMMHQNPRPIYGSFTLGKEGYMPNNQNEYFKNPAIQFKSSADKDNAEFYDKQPDPLIERIQLNYSPTRKGHSLKADTQYWLKHEVYGMK
jgi:hypothetical protein